jgi:hypothetical protein
MSPTRRTVIFFILVVVFTEFSFEDCPPAHRIDLVHTVRSPNVSDNLRLHRKGGGRYQEKYVA